jgi:ubiquinone/menaquinone biosynthesis C-methylase UbiE
MPTPAPTPERKTEVPTDFDKVARRYDLLCTLNPGYKKHLRWSAERMKLAPTARVLDLCCGSGLSTEALLDTYPGARVTGLDASAGMLAVARIKPGLRRARLLHGDAMDPAAVAPGPWDGVLMAYGIRNVPDPDLCLRRVRDLLAPGGVVCFHEYSVADSTVARAVWNAVSFGVVIPLGAAATGSANLFRYLRHSVNHFDGARAFIARLERAGLVDIEHHTMDGWQRNVVHSFVARRGA